MRRLGTWTTSLTALFAMAMTACHGSAPPAPPAPPTPLEAQDYVSLRFACGLCPVRLPPAMAQVTVYGDGRIITATVDTSVRPLQLDEAVRLRAGRLDPDALALLTRRLQAASLPQDSDRAGFEGEKQITDGSTTTLSGSIAGTRFDVLAPQLGYPLAGSSSGRRPQPLELQEAMLDAGRLARTPFPIVRAAVLVEDRGAVAGGGRPWRGPRISAVPTVRGQEPVDRCQLVAGPALARWRQAVEDPGFGDTVLAEGRNLAGPGAPAAAPRAALRRPSLDQRTTSQRPLRWTSPNHLKTGISQCLTDPLFAPAARRAAIAFRRPSRRSRRPEDRG